MIDHFEHMVDHILFVFFIMCIPYYEHFWGELQVAQIDDPAIAISRRWPVVEPSLLHSWGRTRWKSALNPMLDLPSREKNGFFGMVWYSYW